MDDIVVSLIRGGKVVEKIRRPLRWVDGKPAVTYRRKLWTVHDGKVYLDRAATSADSEIYTDGSNASIDYAVVEKLEPTPTLTIGWDPSQQAVILAPATARMLVDAGPGTGKTAVACARIANLIEQGLVEPVNCLIVSFTQTAVHELRGRIGAYLSDPAVASGIRVVTLDAYAWSIRSGFDEAASLTGSYEQGIASALQVILDNPDAAEYLERVEHVIIDEAQDIIGVRADFVCELAKKLDPECGITAFADEAQAIYGFADGSATQSLEDDSNKEPLPQRLRRTEEFTGAMLKKVHRTASPVLAEIFTTVRRMVLDQKEEPATRANNVRAAIERLVGDPNLQARKIDSSTLADASLVLFRRRAEALQASALLHDVPHRLRLGGLPACLAPWIGACFFDVTARRISRGDFNVLWRQRAVGILPDAGSPDVAWNQLSVVAGIQGGFVDIQSLRRALGRRQPPPELCSPDFGADGPVLGTIHGSKGREADNVLLFLPTRNDPHTEFDEETRIMFVGATRARRDLRAGTGFQMWAANLPQSGRAYSYLARNGKQALMTEIGRDGDLRATGLVGRNFFSESDAAWAQQRCLELGAKPDIATASQLAQMGFSYAVAVEGERPIAVLSKGVQDDLRLLAKILSGERKGGLLPPLNIRHVRLTGVRTLVLPPDDPDCERLHQPWASSGFMLAPTIIAYTKIWFLDKR